MKIYTKKGDQGRTSLVDGSPIEKSHVRLDSYGSIDELSSHLGLLISYLRDDDSLSSLADELVSIQEWLFQLGSQLACSNEEMAKKLPTISESEITTLEKTMDEWEKELPPLKNFILPGGHKAASQAHICRTVSRRAERFCVRLSEIEKLNFPAIAFMNRMSDYFYSLARMINLKSSTPDVEWKPN